MDGLALLLLVVKFNLVSARFEQGTVHRLEDGLEGAHVCGAALEKDAGCGPHGKAAIANFLGG